MAGDGCYIVSDLGAHGSGAVVPGQLLPAGPRTCRHTLQWAAMPVQILALETSGPRCGVALLRHDGAHATVVARHHDGVAEHSERLLALVDEVLAEAGCGAADLDAVAFGQGPGGFTGLRVACGVAQGLGFALQKPLLPVMTHLALEAALPATGPAWRLVLQDARMNEVYAAVVYRPQQAAARCVLGPVLVPLAAVATWWQSAPVRRALATLAQADALEPPEAAWCAAGDLAADALAELALPEALPWQAPPLAPTATAVAQVALALWQQGVRVAPEAAQPLYVRDKVAFTTQERAAGAGGNPRAVLPEAG